METITRKKGDFDDLLFKIDLSAYNKTSADITDIFFSVKTKEIDADDSVFYKTLLTSGIIMSGSGTSVNVTVVWNYNEYDNFVVDEEYIAGLFVKFSGDAVADEHVNTLFRLIVTQDFLRA